MRLRLTEFNYGVCTRTGKRYRWDGERWVSCEFRSIYWYRCIAMFGIDIEESYAEWMRQLRGRPWEHDIATRRLRQTANALNAGAIKLVSEGPAADRPTTSKSKRKRSSTRSAPRRVAGSATG